MEINPEEASSEDLYRILIGAILPRPIAWVSSAGGSGNINLAPFSFFTVASVDPPILCFSPLLTNNAAEKDTLRNIRETGEFVVNVVSHAVVAQMNQTSALYPAEVDEFAAAGLTAAVSSSIDVPRVAESLVNFECRIEQIVSFGARPLGGNLVLGRICHIHVHPEVYRNGRIDRAALDAVGRLGGNFYTTTRDCFELARPES